MPLTRDQLLELLALAAKTAVEKSEINRKRYGIPNYELQESVVPWWIRENLPPEVKFPTWEEMHAILSAP
jgi:hypothetical protein